MLKTTIDLIQAEIQADTLYTNVQKVSSFHRIQASTGYRDGATYCATYLTSLGIDAQILQYPATKNNYAGTYKLFQEWHINEAYCDMLYPMKKRIADFRIAPISIIQRSYGCDYRNQPLSVILMDKGNQEEHYQDIDFHNTLIFIHSHFSEYQWALQRGALGFISDFVDVDEKIRTRDDLYDALNYTSFWWKYNKEELPAFGFVLSPRMGDELTKLAHTLQNEFAQGKQPSPYIQVCPYIDATLYDGNIDVVEATLPGKSDETILITAHLCHPCASANDNASGVAGAMEIMRSLYELQKQKRIAPLEKTIKMILVPEFTGTFCYLEDGRDLTKIISGINLDMIGGRQCDMYGPITITKLPYACPSFVDSLACLLSNMMKDSPTSKEAYQLSLVHTADVAFQLGSDHFILNDPCIHIPSIMLGQWPDTYYHTSLDTIDIIDPIVLKFSTTLGASYVYALANYDVSITLPLCKQIRLQFIKAMNAVEPQNEDAYACIYQFFTQAIHELANYSPSQRDTIMKECANYSQLYAMYCTSNSEHIEDAQIPIRTFSTPNVDIKDVFLHDQAKCQRYDQYLTAHKVMMKQHGTLQVLSDYYVDGKRSICSIAKLVIGEVGYGSYQDIHAYIMCMCDVGLMKLR